MIFRELGASGIEVSAVGLGAWAIGGWMWGGTDEQKSIAAIHAALDQGITLVDTAATYGYGRSEEIVGRAIAGRRNHVVLATKCGLIWDREDGTFFTYADEKGISSRPATMKIFRNLRPDSITAELERSLTRLQTDYVDLYQTHWQDKATPIEDTMAALLKLKDQGKIRAIGVSNATVEEMTAYGPIDSDQEKYSLLDRQIETNGTVAYCREHHVGILAYSPLANGLLTGKLRPDREYNPGDLRKANPRFMPRNVERVNAMLEKLRGLAAAHRATLGQLVIAWTFSQPGITCVLCGIRDVAQATENAGAAAISLQPDELSAIQEAIHA
jgi:aryl-alcohol dehydrogenase-like predicted oxidoreductase